MNLLIAMLISMGLIEHENKIYVIDNTGEVELIQDFDSEAEIV